MNRSFFQVSFSVAVLAVLAGCGNKQMTYSTPEQELRAHHARPAELSTAIVEIKAGQGGLAEQRMDTWIKDHAGNPFFAEAYYLRGQAEIVQGKWQEAKISHDIAEDNALTRELKALAMLSRADCNVKLRKVTLGIQQYQQLEMLYRDVTAVSHEEVLFKLGMANKELDCTEAADFYFNKVIEHYATGKYAEQARKLNSKLGHSETDSVTFYALEMATFTDAKQALEQAEIYKQKGYQNVKVVEVREFEAAEYSVRVGKFLNRNAAKRAKEDAELTGLTASIKPGYMNLSK